MEESSNEGIRGIQKVEPLEWGKEVPGEFKTEAEAESVRVIGVNGNPKPVTENHDGDDLYEAESYENITQKVDSTEVEVNIIVKDSVVDSVEPEDSSPTAGVVEVLVERVEVLVEQVECPGDVAELESMVIQDNISQSLGETNGDSKLIEETSVPSSDANDGSSPVEKETVSQAIEEILLASSNKKGNEQIPLPSPDVKSEVPPATADVVSKAIEVTKLPALEQNPEESSGTADLESKEKVDKSSLEAANAGSVDNPEIPASTENQPVIPLSQRNRQPTSWRSCCGLLEFLHRSDR